MIAKLRGVVDEVTGDAIVLDVQGVGYFLACSSRTLSMLPPSGEPATLFTEMVVREDAMLLFGFFTPEERQWFRLLTTVQGVGNKVALSLLSLAGTEELARAISAGDRNFISRADGIGPKLAARLVTELKDKASKMFFPVAASAGNGMRTDGFSGAPAAGFSEDAVHDAVAALVSLGYKSFEAHGAIQGVLSVNDSDMSVQDLVRLGLARLGKA